VKVLAIGLAYRLDLAPHEGSLFNEQSKAAPISTNCSLFSRRGLKKVVIFAVLVTVGGLRSGEFDSNGESIMFFKLSPVSELWLSCVYMDAWLGGVDMDAVVTDWLFNRL